MPHVDDPADWFHDVVTLKWRGSVATTRHALEFTIQPADLGRIQNLKLDQQIGLPGGLQI
jgi:hypothetical protein